ncbi:XP-A family Rhp14 [Schizosaccharomyces japonicus yFS275]|uniref:XP-A family Rhp14 n=1 Tax=Schizosaccharomyces japonicus (strain yFS275 / FY16936) TaxID=402676 RepID=B6K268_SCHJY|nr:XP-A family Rhp14 [Schizosaccharomyces japonicus yFS275]EEB07249.1 XP-A family Rhp14 [Schizosaccharomyces japonicus yFS275]
MTEKEDVKDTTTHAPPTIVEQRAEIERLKQLAGVEEVEVNGPAEGDPNAKRQRTSKTVVTEEYIQFDFSKVKDTKGGFLPEDDGPQREKPAERVLREQEERLRRLRNAPVQLDPEQVKTCFECSSAELDAKYLEVFRCRVCHVCREKYPEKYSLLTKSECKQDYLLTEPELRDDTVMPHLLKANPHQQGWSNMMLYLRYQVEEFAKNKWGSLEALDEEFERREAKKKEQNEKKFAKQLLELRKRTRTSNYSKMSIRQKNKHVHAYTESFEKKDEPGVIVQRCSCGLEVEQLEI